MQRPSHAVLFQALALALGAALSTSACSSGSSGGGGGGGGGGGNSASTPEEEPNDTSGTATALTLGMPGTGSVATPGDVDFWSVNLVAGNVYSLRMRAVSLDQDGWSAAPNEPLLSLFDTDGATLLRSHVPTSWFFMRGDLDILAYPAPATGQYFLSISQFDALSAGGEYAIEVVDLGLGALIPEAEGIGVTGVNDSPGTAEPLAQGWHLGFHVDDEMDYYSVAIPEAGIAHFELWSHRNGIWEATTEYSDLLLSINDPLGTTVLQDVDDALQFDVATDHLFTVADTYIVAVVEAFGQDAEYLLNFEFTPLTGALAEVEPNETSGAAQAVAYGDLVTGSTNVAEVDFFSFAGTAGDLITISPFMLVNSEAAVGDIEIELFDTDGVTPLTYAYQDFQTPVLRTILQSNGTFFIQILPDVGAPVASDYAFALELQTPAGYEVEANDSAATANTLDANGRAAGAIGAPGDVDVFSFTADEGEVVVFAIYAGNESVATGYENFDDYGSDLDPQLTLRDDQALVLNMTELPANPFLEGGPKSVTNGIATIEAAFVAPEQGTYTIEVRDVAGSGSALHTYVLERS